MWIFYSDQLGTHRFSGFLAVNHPQFCVQVMRCISQLHSNSCQQPFNLGACPPKHSWKQRICINRHSFKHVELMVPTKVLELGVFRPWTLGQLFINKQAVPFSLRDGGTYLVDIFFDIHKPSLLHPRFPGWGRCHILAKHARWFMHVLDG